MKFYNERETLAIYQEILGKELDKLKEKLHSGDDGFSEQEINEISQINEKLTKVTGKLNSLIKTILKK